MLRLPGLPNRKYPGVPLSRLLTLDDRAYRVEELDAAFPALTGMLPPPPTPKPRQKPKEPLQEGGASPPARKAVPWQAPAAEAEAEDEPPVLLTEAALRVWRGEQPKFKDDGTVNRHASLMNIGRVIYNAGGTRPTVVRALAERDVTLGWQKYSDRKPAAAAARYHAIMDELERHGRNPSRTPAAEPASGDLTVDLLLAVLRNGGLTPAERIALIFTLPFILKARAAAQLRPDGLAPVFNPAIAEAAGLKRKQVGTALRNIAAAGPLRHRTDKDTHNANHTAIDTPGDTYAAMLAPYASVSRAPETRAGGKRLTFDHPKHPDAPVKATTTYACFVCGDSVHLATVHILNPAVSQPTAAKTSASPALPVDIQVQKGLENRDSHRPPVVHLPLKTCPVSDCRWKVPQGERRCRAHQGTREGPPQRRPRSVSGVWRSAAAIRLSAVVLGAAGP